MAHRIYSFFNGTLLVAGTAIGAGMLALPVATCLAGFLPACIVYGICWLFMAATGLLLLEVCLWMPEDANIVSMASHLLGPAGKMVSWVLYLFLFYCLMIAYTSGGGGFIKALVSSLTQYSLPHWTALLLFVGIFSPVVHLGARFVDRANSILMIGLIVTYVGFVVLGWKHIIPTNLQTADLWQGMVALPIVFSAFSYQGIIPSLTTYLRRNTALVKRAIWFGTALPLVIYIIWEGLILGIIPVRGEHGLFLAKEMGVSAIDPLKYFLSSSLVTSLGQGFAFFALTSSFLGVSLGLIDFLADGFKISKTGMNKWFLSLAVFTPPFFIALGNPAIFLSALTYAGGIGCALLLGLLPVVMVWVGRYHKGYRGHVQLLGGKPFLILLALFVLFELLIELKHTSYG
ncbi:MAG: tyrosine transporter [Simkania sp.]|nr:tyrosine transporter [Simkania sp.]